MVCLVHPITISRSTIVVQRAVARLTRGHCPVRREMKHAENEDQYPTGQSETAQLNMSSQSIKSMRSTQIWARAVFASAPPSRKCVIVRKLRSSIAVSFRERCQAGAQKIQTIIR
jgi:hypothetical protein